MGGGLAYVTSYPGYDTYDVGDPATLKRLGNAVDGGPNSFKQMVPNGSGVGLAAVGLNPRDDSTHDVWRYRVNDAAVTTDLVALFATPGIAKAVTIYRGLAYAADGLAGVQVISLLAPDTPPRVVRTLPRNGAVQGPAATLQAFPTSHLTRTHSTVRRCASWRRFRMR